MIGGRIADPGTFPSLAYVLDVRGEYGDQCTGTVVAPNLVLTAGHCAVDEETGVVDEPAGFRVVTGNVDWQSPEREVLGVSRVIVDPSFRLSGALEGWADAALLVLSAPTSAPPLKIATYNEAQLWNSGRSAAIVGWGDTFYGQEAPTVRLRWADTVVQSSSWCGTAAPGFHPVGQLCVIDPPSYATGACEGDSGGPLLAVAEKQFVEIGIARGVYGECSTRAPSVFTRTALIASWVQQWEAALPPPALATEVPASSPAPSTQPEKPAQPVIAGVYHGATEQPRDQFSLVVGRDEKEITALATHLVYHCPDGRTLRSPLAGLSNGDPQPLDGASFGVSLVGGGERIKIEGSIDAEEGVASGTLRGTYAAGDGERCSTGTVSWSAARATAASVGSAIATPGTYRGQTNQQRTVILHLARGGDVLVGLHFAAAYHCGRHRRIRRAVWFLSHKDTETLEDPGTFTVLLGGPHYHGRLDGTFGLTSDSAFGTLEAAIHTRRGVCRTGLVPWQAKTTS